MVDLAERSPAVAGVVADHDQRAALAPRREGDDQPKAGVSHEAGEARILLRQLQRAAGKVGAVHVEQLRVTAVHPDQQRAGNLSGLADDPGRTPSNGVRSVIVPVSACTVNRWAFSSPSLSWTKTR